MFFFHVFQESEIFKFIPVSGQVSGKQKKNVITYTEFAFQRQ